MKETVILVDRQDQPIGTAEKMAAHRQGSLHRAFSIFVLNAQDQLLLQRRAAHKYHSGGLWTNTCCSHPRPGETTPAAAQRRLQEEMGFSCDLREIFSFVYQAQLDRGLIEYEFDHVFLGRFDGVPQLNPEEADAYEWIEVAELQAEIRKHPDRYTYWLKDCIDRFADYLTGLRVQV
ncbi:isopentenyl-diphosphate delta-isomerase [Thalassoporum mexicanum PCC 7367]|uniref:isopentenyl-diphosphate Delta-isomerase n=1 Tax=Thalassoporum mexicanum TaxID=3457544 RepID=UPI00029FDDCD|nr:isopentenyl-diphosphate Delta-isomerase [Pseudanabaena sp. PCC 7367]AFY70531.1 isopentenyl-diphosphate delta-isomerase [Pseudanabaena sp. PCC 7367]